MESELIKRFNSLRPRVIPRPPSKEDVEITNLLSSLSTPASSMSSTTTTTTTTTTQTKIKDIDVDKYLALLEKTTPIIPPSHYFVNNDDNDEDEEGGRFIPTSTSLFTNTVTNTSANTNTSTQEEADLIALLHDETTLESTITERDDDDEEKGMEEISRRMKALGSVSNSSTTKGEGKKNDEGLLVHRPVISDLEVFDLIRDRDDEDVDSDSESSDDSSSSSSSSSS